MGAGASGDIALAPKDTTENFNVAVDQSIIRCLELFMLVNTSRDGGNEGGPKTWGLRRFSQGGGDQQERDPTERLWSPAASPRSWWSYESCFQRE